MRTRACTVLLVWLCAGPLRAQGTTAAMLDSARTFHHGLQIERAIPILRNVISPSSPYEVTRTQRVEAYKYLGAAFAIQGKRDSALIFFRAALERDAFVDLDPAAFTPAELGAFNEARLTTFAVGVRPIEPTTFDPRTQGLTLTLVTTHSGDLQARLRPVGGGTDGVVFAGQSDGVREVVWDGLLGNGRLAPPGRYELLVSGVSRETGRADSSRLYLDIQHDRPELEALVPDLRPDELMPERYSGSASAAELLKGVVIGGAAVLIPTVLASRDLGTEFGITTGAVAGASLVTGVVAFIVRRSNPEIAENIVENQRRRDARAQQNAEIQARNDERIRQTRLTVSPAAGGGQ